MVASSLTALAAQIAGALSSTAQNLNRGKPTEIDVLNGFIVRRGLELGIPTPVNQALYTFGKLAEKKATPGWMALIENHNLTSFVRPLAAGIEQVRHPSPQRKCSSLQTITFIRGINANGNF